MKCKDNTVYIEHMLSCIEKINSYTEGSREKFLDSPLVQDAVILVHDYLGIDCDTIWSVVEQDKSLAGRWTGCG